jgi:hypothetical protein
MADLDVEDPAVLIDVLRSSGEQLPAALEAGIVASRAPAVVETLLEVLRHESASLDEDVGDGWAAVHAARLLVARREEAAIAALVAHLVVESLDDGLSDEVARIVPELGAAVVAPALRALEEFGGDADSRRRLATLLTDPRVAGALTPEQKATFDRLMATRPSRPPRPRTDTPAVRPPRPGRNEPCWCGSARKYKKCHLAEDEAAGRTQ